MSSEIPNVFVSATSKDLRTVRESVKAALLSMGCHPVEQSHFPPGEYFQTVSDRLREMISSCEAVIHIVGMRYGEEPSPDSRPTGEPRLSFTQMEADLARKLNKPLYVFICPEDFPYDESHFANPESGEAQSLQLAWRKSLCQSEGLYIDVSDKQALELKVRELKIELSALKKRVERGNTRLSIAITSAAVALILLAGASGWMIHQQGKQRDSIETALDTIKSDPEKLAAQLRKNINDASELKKAEAGENWDEKLKIEEERKQQLFRVDDLIRVIQSGISEEADPVFKQATAILADTKNGSPEKALKYLESQQIRLMSEVEQLASLEENISRRKQEKLRPLLLEAGLHENRFEWEDALKALRLAVKLAPNWWEAPHLLGNLLKNRALYQESESHLRLALAIAPNETDRATSESSLGRLLEFQGKFEEAEKYYRLALLRRTNKLGPEAPATLTSVTELAFVLKLRGHYREAETLLRDTLAHQELTLGRVHEDTLDSINNLASILKSQGKFKEAEPLFTEAMEGRKSVLGPDHPDTLASMNHLAFFYESTGKYDQAAPLYDETYQSRKRILGETHPNTLTSLNSIAVLATDAEDYEKADRIFRDVLQQRADLLGADHPSTTATKSDLAYLCVLRERQEEAETLFRETLTSRQKKLGQSHPDTLGTMNDLASILLAKQELEEASSIIREALSHCEKELGIAHPLTLNILGNRALLLEEQGNPEAEKIYQEVARGLLSVLGENHPSTLRAQKKHQEYLSRRNGNSAPLEKETAAPQKP